MSKPVGTRNGEGKKPYVKVCDAGIFAFGNYHFEHRVIEPKKLVQSYSCFTEEMWLGKKLNRKTLSQLQALSKATNSIFQSSINPKK